MRLMPQPPMAVYSGSWKRVHIQAHIAAPVFLSPDEGLHQLNWQVQVHVWHPGNAGARGRCLGHPHLLHLMPWISVASLSKPGSSPGGSWSIVISTWPLGSLAVLFNSSAQASMISWWARGFTPNDHKIWSSKDPAKMVWNELGASPQVFKLFPVPFGLRDLLGHG